MKKVTIKCHLSIGYSGANHEDELEVEVQDNATQEEIDKQIDEQVTDWANNYIDVGWKIIQK